MPPALGTGGTNAPPSTANPLEQAPSQSLEHLNPKPARGSPASSSRHNTSAPASSAGAANQRNAAAALGRLCRPSPSCTQCPAPSAVAKHCNRLHKPAPPTVDQNVRLEEHATAEKQAALADPRPSFAAPSSDLLAALPSAQQPGRA
eukprot:scaffold38750_cov13-Tisochrysis_lutea.AAC.1